MLAETNFLFDQSSLMNFFTFGGMNFQEIKSNIFWRQNPRRQTDELHFLEWIDKRLSDYFLDCRCISLVTLNS